MAGNSLGVPTSTSWCWGITPVHQFCCQRQCLLLSTFPKHCVLLILWGGGGCAAVWVFFLELLPKSQSLGECSLCNLWVRIPLVTLKLQCLARCYMLHALCCVWLCEKCQSYHHGVPFHLPFSHSFEGFPLLLPENVARGSDGSCSVRTDSMSHCCFCITYTESPLRFFLKSSSVCLSFLSCCWTSLSATFILSFDVAGRGSFRFFLTITVCRQNV